MRVLASKLLNFASFRYNMNTYPKCNPPLRDRCSAASLRYSRYRNRAEISVVMCEQAEALSGRYDFRVGAKDVSVNLA